ncbi:MAG: TadE/TadG family type IV pilus assembly protein [Pseudomonadota bacterium]
MTTVRPGPARAAARLASRWATCRRGVATIEFGMLAPMILILFFGMVEASDIFSVKRRVANAANALVDLVGQSEQITPDELTDIFTGVKKMIENEDLEAVTMEIYSVVRDDEETDSIIVQWSRDDHMTSVLAPGSAFSELQDASVLKQRLSVLVVDIEYEYASMLSTRIYGSPVTIAERAVRIPRRVSRVQFCPTDEPDECL